MSKFQQLAKVHAPDGAVAVLTQASARETTRMPRYMTAGDSANAKRPRWIPAASAGQWLVPLYKAYLSLSLIHI